MSVMGTGVRSPGRLLTRADLDALPADGLRHELIDGAFLMTPSPSLPHQLMAFRLARLLDDAAASQGLSVVMAPFDVVLGRHLVVPDIIVAPRTAFTDRDLPVAPLLVVEVQSPSTKWVDAGRKREIYQESGVVHYWLAHPLEPGLTLLRLVQGEYQVVGAAHGDQWLDVDDPVPVRLNPAELARG